MDMVNDTENLYFKSKAFSLTVLAIAAIICSRALFLFFNDSEGPNLLIVAVMALVVYFLSLAAYVFGPSKLNGIKRLSVAISIQILSVIALYFCMN